MRNAAVHLLPQAYLRDMTRGQMVGQLRAADAVAPARSRTAIARLVRCWSAPTTRSSSAEAISTPCVTPGRTCAARGDRLPAETARWFNRRALARDRFAVTLAWRARWLRHFGYQENDLSSQGRKPYLSRYSLRHLGCRSFRSSLNPPPQSSVRRQHQ